MPGIIKLLDGEGEIIRCNAFTSKTEKGKIIEFWKRIYAKGFLRCTVVEERDEYKILQKSRFKKGSMVETKKLNKTGISLKRGSGY